MFSVYFESNHTGIINIKSEIINRGLEATTSITVRDDLILLTGTDKIIQSGDVTTLTAKLPPKPGTVIENQNILLTKDVDDTDWSLNLTATKEIIQEGETTTLNMVVTDENNNAKENIVLNLYKVVNMAKELVATLVTDSSGMASYNYLGVGAGFLGFRAESGILQSEIYALTDTVKFDNGTIANHNDIWDYDSSTTVLTRYDEYSSITEKVSGTDARLYCKNLPTSAVVEIELCQVNGSITQGGLNFYDGTSYRQFFSLNDLGYSSSIIGQWVRLQVTYGNGSLTVVSLDDPTKTVTKSYNNNITAISPSTNSSITEHRFRNLRVYNA